MASGESRQDSTIKIGISACLYGQKVRYNAEHLRDHFLTDTVARFVEFVPVCPEVDIGLGTPRETIRLVKLGEAVRLVAPRSGADHTVEMRRYARGKARELLAEGLSGFVFKKNSPSCGLYRVKIYNEGGSTSGRGRGMFAEALTSQAPLLPVEEEGRLNDPRLRENFFERVFAHQRLRALFQGRWNMADLVRFQTAEKLLLKAHDAHAQPELGEMVAHGKAAGKAELAHRYQERFMEAMAKKTTLGRHVNVLRHISGPLRRTLSPPDYAELGEAIDDYRHQLVPLIVPITLVRHFVRRYEVEYLKGQTYLEPHPKELMLRNHV